MKTQQANSPLTRSQASTRYSAFLLRCWRTEDDWAFSLEDVATRRRQQALGAEAVVALLQQQLAALSEDD